MFKSHSKTGDYHGDMNATNFRKWIDEKLIPNIPPNSVIVMDNAAYHSTQIEKKPTMSSLKSVMQQWLERRGVQHDSSMRKCDLMKVIDEQNTEKKYKIDEILKENGHIVLRLPPYHPDLNPIELVWGYVKGELARMSIDSNLDKKIKDLELLFSNYSTEKWRNCDDHVIKNEDEYYKSDRVFDDVLDRFIIEVNENDDEDEDDDDDEQVQTESEHETCRATSPPPRLSPRKEGRARSCQAIEIRDASSLKASTGRSEDRSGRDGCISSRAPVCPVMGASSGAASCATALSLSGTRTTHQGALRVNLTGVSGPSRDSPVHPVTGCQR
ncbi:unnamed protein product [Plutella xylostella]|uniref:(diamondback moth) hypothetical protein n=1 Tax=Plutella xylostella TaxID=51655 RepID=A0A8S4G7A1_PLUXY|nr:unnamed protein product [Plutella xylostella]